MESIDTESNSNHNFIRNLQSCQGGTTPSPPVSCQIVLDHLHEFQSDTTVTGPNQFPFWSLGARFRSLTCNFPQSGTLGIEYEHGAVQVAVNQEEERDRYLLTLYRFEKMILRIPEDPTEWYGVIVVNGWFAHHGRLDWKKLGDDCSEADEDGRNFEGWEGMEGVEGH